MRRKKYRPKRKLFKGPLPVKHVFLFSFLFFIGSTLLSLWLIDRAIEPVIMTIAQREIQRVATEVINESFHENLTDILGEEPPYFEKYQEGSTRPTFYFNPKLYNEVRAETIKDIEGQLDISGENPFATKGTAVDLDKEQFKSVIYYVPLGAVTGTSLFANLGPKIPVEMSLVGHAELDYKVQYTESGINNTAGELFAEVKVNVEVIIPTLEQEAPIVQNIKVTDFFYQGEVPEFYSSDGSSISPAIVAPESKKAND